MFTPPLESAPISQSGWANRYDPTASRMFSLGIAQGWDMTTFGIGESIRRLEETRTMGAVVTEEEWRASKDFREGLEYEEGMRAGFASLLAERHDKRRIESFLQERSSGLSFAAMIAGNFVGSVPDPLNFIPFLGAEVIAGRAVGILGRVGGRLALSSAEAVIGVGLMQPAIAFEHDLYQDPWDYTMAVRDIAMAAGIGAGFGALGLSIGRYSSKERLAATSKGVSDMMAGRPVDVGAVLSRPRDALSRVKALAEKLKRRGSVPEELADDLNLLAADVGETVRAQGIVKTLMKDGELSPNEAAALDGVNLSPEMRTVIEELKETRALHQEAVEAAPPGDKARALAVAEIANDTAEAKAVQKMEDALRSDQGMTRVANPQELGAAIKEKAEAQVDTFKAQADDLEIQAKAARSKADALPEGDEGKAKAASDTIEQEKAVEGLRAEERFYREIAQEADFGDDLDFTVNRAQEEFRPDMPEIKRDEIGLPDEIEVEGVNARFKEAEANGEIDAASVKDIDDAEFIAERINVMEQAVETGSACILRGGNG